MTDKTILICDKCGSFLRPQAEYIVSESDAKRFEVSTDIRNFTRLLGHWICRNCDLKVSPNIPVQQDPLFRLMKEAFEAF
jgi:hypothetical protein